MALFRRKQPEKPVRGAVEIVHSLADAGVLKLEEPHPLRSENYEPHFPRTGTHRRVLGHITPEVDRDHEGPRNTVPALTAALIRDDHTDIWYPEQVQPFLNALVDAGLADCHDGVYSVTEKGWRELMN